jgi:hypothetical protein
MPRSRFISLAVLVLVAPLCGCGKHRAYPVTGKVTCKGKLLTSGTVMFVPEEGPAAMGNIAPDGTYKLFTHELGEGAIPGEHRVAVNSRGGGEGDLPASPAAVRPAVPPKYTKVATSGLKVQVKSEANEIDLTLD